MTEEEKISSEIAIPQTTKTTAATEIAAETNLLQQLATITPEELQKLDTESVNIINKVIEEEDINKTKSLAQLFNNNQSKKTMIRLNKMGGLLDKIVDQLITRVTEKPDNMSNQELLQAIKTIQDSVEKNQTHLNQNVDTPLIQINQQTNEIHLSDDQQRSRESRERIRYAVMAVLENAAAMTKIPSTEAEVSALNNVVEAELASHKEQEDTPVLKEDEDND